MIGKGAMALSHKRVDLDIERNFFTCSVVKHWERFPRGVVYAPSVETFKVRLSRALSIMI